MATTSAFAAIDIGSTKIVTVVGDTSDAGLLRVIGVGTARSDGVEKGQVSHIGKAVEAIQLSVEQAERVSGTRIVAASVGISGTHLASLNNRGIVAIPDPSQAISADDAQRVVDAARMVSLKSNRQMLHALPRYFVVDGQDRVADPVGMHGQRLDVEMHIVTCGVNPMQNAVKCVEEAGLQVDTVIANPVAAANVLLRPEERTEGVVLVDIGGGTTDIAVFLDGALIHTSSLPIGGANITRDLVVGLRCPQDAGRGGQAGARAGDRVGGGRRDHDRLARLRARERAERPAPAAGGDRAGAGRGDPLDGDGGSEARWTSRPNLGGARHYGRYRGTGRHHDAGGAPHAAAGSHRPSRGGVWTSG